MRRKLHACPAGAAGQKKTAGKKGYSCPAAKRCSRATARDGLSRAECSRAAAAARMSRETKQRGQKAAHATRSAIKSLREALFVLVALPPDVQLYLALPGTAVPTVRSVPGRLQNAHPPTWLRSSAGGRHTPWNGPRSPTQDYRLAPPLDTAPGLRAAPGSPGLGREPSCKHAT